MMRWGPADLEIGQGEGLIVSQGAVEQGELPADAIERFANRATGLVEDLVGGELLEFVDGPHPEE